MNKKIYCLITIVLLVVLWFTLISSFIDMFRVSYAITELQDFYSSEELSTSLLFFNLTNAVRLEGIQIAITGGFLLVYYFLKKQNE